MSLLQLPGLVKRDFFQVGFGQWTPQGVHWILYRAWTANIGRVKSQYTSEGCIKNVDTVVWLLQCTDNTAVWLLQCTVNTVVWLLQCTGTICGKARGYHGEWSPLGSPKAKTRGAAGPDGFGRETYRGTTFTMIPPRLFHKMPILQHPGLVKRDFFQANGLPGESIGHYTGLGRQIYVELNPNILVRDAIRMYILS